MRYVTMVLALALAAPAFAQTASDIGPQPAKRWYTDEHVKAGAPLFAEHCAACHGATGAATPEWRKRTADGKFPPPPLNGTAHTWHHPFRILARQIKFGAPGGVGSMPAFADKLSDEQIVAILAWVQDLWPDQVYDAWWDIEMRSRGQ